MVTGSVAGDSTGYSSNRFVRWFGDAFIYP